MAIKHRGESIEFLESAEKFQWRGKYFETVALAKKAIDAEQSFVPFEVLRWSTKHEQAGEFETVTVTSRNADEEFWITYSHGQRAKISRYGSSKLYAITPENEAKALEIEALESVIFDYTKRVEAIKKSMTPVTVPAKETK